MEMLGSKKIQLVALLLTLIGGCSTSPSTSFGNLDVRGTVAPYLNSFLHDKRNPMSAVFDEVLFTWLPKLIGQAPSNENGTRSEFRDYLLQDTSNDDAVHMTGQQLIERSGYKYEVFEALADDSYVTQVTHIINPLADPKFLRQPPVLMEHGGTIDPTAYLIGSSIQHHPEKWPRRPEDGPITSWNRSLAFVLANNGFDVWLAETRGSNDNNKKRVQMNELNNKAFQLNKNKNMTARETIEQLNRKDYWDFSEDDIIAHELKSHIDLVLEKTGATQLHLMTFSLSTPTSLAFLSIRPDYAKKINGYVSMAPIVSGEGVNGYLKLMLQTLCPLLPNEIGTIVFSDTMFTQPMRDILVAMAGSREIRYSVTKAIITVLMGPSAKYQTLLDLNVLGHMLRELSFKEAKQLCQQTKTNKLQKYDYGTVKNQLLYGQPEPPVYDLSNLQISDWIVVAGANDKLGTLEIMDHLYQIVNPKPSARIIAPGLNHLDLIAGLENDIYVNLPILKYFIGKSIIPKSAS